MSSIDWMQLRSARVAHNLLHISVAASQRVRIGLAGKCIVNCEGGSHRSIHTTRQCGRQCGCGCSSSTVTRDDLFNHVILCQCVQNPPLVHCDAQQQLRSAQPRWAKAVRFVTRPAVRLCANSARELSSSSARTRLVCASPASPVQYAWGARVRPCRSAQIALFCHVRCFIKPPQKSAVLPAGRSRGRLYGSAGEARSLMGDWVGQSRSAAVDA